MLWQPQIIRVTDAVHHYAGFPNIVNGFVIDAKSMRQVRAIFSMTYPEILVYLIPPLKHDALFAVGMSDGSTSKIVGGATDVRGIFNYKMLNS
ncbi:MAG: hypothetical protein KAJ51_03625 [Thermoplasmata archaeon]|nr:hypothetical protein [Thermoplasmata archaeon]